MKFTKLIAIILCISMLAVAFVGCNGGNDPVVEEPTTNEQPPVVDDTKKETMVKKTFVSFTSQTSAAIWGREISEYSVMAGRFTIKEGYLDQLNVFMSTLGDITLSLYKWTRTTKQPLQAHPSSRRCS